MLLRFIFGNNFHYATMLDEWNLKRGENGRPRQNEKELIRRVNVFCCKEIKSGKQQQTFLFRVINRKVKKNVRM